MWKNIQKTDAGSIKSVKICENEIKGSEIRQKLQVYNQAEQEKLQKIQQIINKQKQ